MSKSLAVLTLVAIAMAGIASSQDVALNTCVALGGGMGSTKSTMTGTSATVCYYSDVACATSADALCGQMRMAMAAGQPNSECKDGCLSASAGTNTNTNTETKKETLNTAANSQDSDVAAKAMKCYTDYMTTKKCGEGCEMVTTQGQQQCTINMQDGIRQAAAAAAAEDGGAGGALAEQMLNNMASNPALTALVKKCVALTDCNADADCQSAEGGGGCSPTEKATVKVVTSGTAASGGAATTSGTNVAGGNPMLNSSPAVTDPGPAQREKEPQATDCGSAVTVAVSQVVNPSDGFGPESFEFKLGGARTGEAAVNCYSTDKVASCCAGGGGWILKADRNGKGGTLNADPSKRAGEVTVTCQAIENKKCVGQGAMVCKDGKCAAAAVPAAAVPAGGATAAPAAGDKCKGFGTLADMSLAAPDGRLDDAEMAKNVGDKDFLSAMLAMNAQDEKCEGNAACPAASQCVKAGTDCEPDFIPFMKVTKCGAGVIAKVTKAFNRAKVADAKKAKAKLATAKVAVTAAKAKKEKADKEVAACGDTCATEVKVAASTAASEYEAAQRTETEAATKASNADASASNAADAATKADAESGAAPVAVGAAAVAGVVFAQLF